MIRRAIASAMTISAATQVDTIVSTLNSMPKACATAWWPTLIFGSDSPSWASSRAESSWQLAEPFHFGHDGEENEDDLKYGQSEEDSDSVGTRQERHQQESTVIPNSRPAVDTVRACLLGVSDRVMRVTEDQVSRAFAQPNPRPTHVNTPSNK